MERQPPPLQRPFATYKVVLRTPLARQLYGVTLGMANALSKLGLATQRSLPQQRGKQLAALAFEVIRGLQAALEAEIAKGPAQGSPRVTAFPAVLQRELKFCHANAIRTMELLLTLDMMASTWYDLWFLGKLSQEELEQKSAAWKKRFRRASRQINSLLQC